MSYLNGSDGSKKQEAPNVGSAPDWCAVSVAPVGTLENHYRLSLTALSDNNTGANRSGHLFLTCGDANLSIPVTQKSLVASSFTLSGLPTDTATISLAEELGHRIHHLQIRRIYKVSQQLVLLL